MADEKATTPEFKPPRRRSPNYPIIGLEKALERAATLNEKSKGHAAPVGTVHTWWNYKTATGDQIVAALKAFGLIDVEGIGKDRTIKVSDSARRILRGDQGKEDRLKTAALKPTLHGELWTKYGADIPDDVARIYLTDERGFNEASVDEFMAQYKATISYAKLSDSDKVASDDDEADSSESGGKGMSASTVTEVKGKTPPAPPMVNPPFSKNRAEDPPPPAGHIEFPYYLARGQKAILYVPPVMNRKQYDLLKRQIENSLLVLEATAIAEEPPPVTYPRSATWQNKNHDQPVTVLGEAGEHNGRHYMRIAESDTAVPEDELEFDDANAKGASY